VISAELRRLRAQAVSHSMFQSTGLSAALDRLGFVQADPIRAPARAQDLILRPRVEGYLAGDLERHYPALDVEEDFLYAYGFLPRANWRLLHPRRTRRLTALERDVLAAVRDMGAVHPKQLEAAFGRKRVVNAWGGHSQATKSALERLHFLGLTRIVRRDAGIRVYEAAAEHVSELTARERFCKLLLLLVNVLTPVTEQTLHSVAAYLRRPLDAALDHRKIVRDMVAEGTLERQSVEGLTYISLPGLPEPDDDTQRVHLLAPFDPLVWDRRRFEHLWQWSYRFEAYTPPAKRVRGYYALPLLWRNAVIGWGNVRADGTALDVDVGFVEAQPRERAFRRELDAEIARMSTFLGLGKDIAQGALHS
jgi:uncharacterized protein YcaQ